MMTAFAARKTCPFKRSSALGDLKSRMPPLYFRTLNVLDGIISFSKVTKDRYLKLQAIGEDVIFLNLARLWVFRHIWLFRSS